MLESEVQLIEKKRRHLAYEGYHLGQCVDVAVWHLWGYKTCTEENYMGIYIKQHQNKSNILA